MLSIANKQHARTATSPARLRPRGVKGQPWLKYLQKIGLEAPKKTWNTLDSWNKKALWLVAHR
jgi:hypothetical protein